MAFVVLDGCILCKYTDCVGECPVENCFHEGPNMLVIDPKTCIDCGQCTQVCQANAIVDEYDVPEKKDFLVELNAEYAVRWPPINQVKAPLPDADKWNGVPDKWRYFKP